MEKVNLFTVFTTGLLTGGLTCMAVQGGLLATSIAQHTENKLVERLKVRHALPILAFLLTKLIAYALLGVLLGWFGSLFILSVQMQILLQLAVVIFMFCTAFNMLNVHPIFRYFVIQPPRFFTRFMRRQSKSKHIFTPAFLGALTVFIPCGTTQAMMVLAIGTGNPLLGGLVMAAFTIGTSPVFFLLGYFASKLSDVFQKSFMKFAAFIIIVLALFNLNNTLALMGGNFTFSKLAQNINCFISFCSEEKSGIFAVEKPVDTVSIEFSDAGYTPNQFTVKHGTKVTMNLINNEGRGCVQAFTIPQLGIQKVVPVGKKETITFTAPEKPGEIAFTCSMGMYPGTIKVI